MWYTVAAMLLFFGIQAILLAPHPETVSYSEFKSLVKANKVSDLMLYKDTITGTLALTGLEGVLPKEKIEEIKRAGKGAPGWCRSSRPRTSGSPGTWRIHGCRRCCRGSCLR